jgi:hypothetical protein
MGRAWLFKGRLRLFPSGKRGARQRRTRRRLCRRVRLGREPEKEWRGPCGRKPGICQVVVPIEDDGQPIGHDRVPTVFWGSQEPGAGNGSSRTIPTALILMGDWCVPERCTTTKRMKTRVRTTGKDRPSRRYQAFDLTKKDSPREFFRLTRRGLMGDPFSAGPLFRGHPHPPLAGCLAQSRYLRV